MAFCCLELRFRIGDRPDRGNKAPATGIFEVEIGVMDMAQRLECNFVVRIFAVFEQGTAVGIMDFNVHNVGKGRSCGDGFCNVFDRAKSQC